MFKAVEVLFVTWAGRAGSWELAVPMSHQCEQWLCLQISKMPLTLTKSPLTQDLAAPQRGAEVWESKIFFIPEHFHPTHWASWHSARIRQPEVVEKRWKKPTLLNLRQFLPFAREWLKPPQNMSSLHYRNTFLFL